MSFGIADYGYPGHVIWYSCYEIFVYVLIVQSFDYERNL